MSGFFLLVGFGVAINWIGLVPRIYLKKTKDYKGEIMVSPKYLETKDWWDKVKIIAEILAIIAIIFYGNAINSSLKEREINLQLVQSAIEVLQTEPNNSTSALREWAVKVIDELSGVPLGEQVKSELLNNPLPSRWNDKATWDDSKVWKD